MIKPDVITTLKSCQPPMNVKKINGSISHQSIKLNMNNTIFENLRRESIMSRFGINGGYHVITHQPSFSLTWTAFGDIHFMQLFDGLQLSNAGW